MKVLLLLVVPVLVFGLVPQVYADNSWRYAAHNRNIDIDICIKCESPIPGPPGPQGPPGEQGPPGPATESHTGTLSVIVNIVCSESGIPGPPDPQFCEKLVLPPPSDFTIQVLGGNPTEPFLGSSDGTEVIIESGAYEVILFKVPLPIFDPVRAIPWWSFSEDCIGSIAADESKTCTITTVYEAGGGGTPLRPLT